MKNLKPNHTLDDMLTTCINPKVLQQFHESGLCSDPCEHCEHNEITISPGTFVKMKQLSTTTWAELHQCERCHTTYEIPTSDISLP
ncbi:MAG: hypothetical protein GX348_03700 [Veillonellaceae bacterium]|nr:hypothetical protein [Veillonellaceae bacterium]